MSTHSHAAVTTVCHRYDNDSKLIEVVLAWSESIGFALSPSSISVRHLHPSVNRDAGSIETGTACQGVEIQAGGGLRRR